MHNCLSLTICIFIENTLVTIGGIEYSEKKWEIFSSVEVTKIQEKNMSCLIDQIPTDLWLHSATVIPTGILVCGGYTTISEKRCYEYKKTTGSWESFANMTTERSDFDMKFLNQAVWAIGGYGESGPEPSLDKYDLQTNVWTKHNIPFNVNSYCLTKITDDKLILIGGFQNGGWTYG